MRSYVRYRPFVSITSKLIANVIAIPYTVHAKKIGTIERLDRKSLVPRRYRAPFRDHLDPVHGRCQATGAVPAFTAATNWSLSGITSLVSDRLRNITWACARRTDKSERAFTMTIVPFFLFFSWTLLTADSPAKIDIGDRRYSRNWSAIGSRTLPRICARYFDESRTFFPSRYLNYLLYSLIL